ncbi:MAG TPA: hypothetical protein VEA44_12670, partial [Caulobacter sp.]|nr:hypothetical protein [Caulobacter sp.]
MTKLRRVASHVLDQAAQLREAYPPEAAVLAAAVEGKPVELQVIVRNAVFDRLSIGFTLDGVFAGEEPYVPLGLERRLGELAMTSGDRTLGVQIIASGAFFHLSGPVRVPPEGGELVIDVWNRLYPPRLTLDGRPLNPA